MGTEKSRNPVVAVLAFAAASAACAGESAAAPPPSSSGRVCLAIAPPPTPRTESGEEIPAVEITPPHPIPGSARITHATLPNDAAGPPAMLLLVRCTIRTDGTASDCTMICSHPAHDALLLEWVSTQRYTPATYRGRPIDLAITFPFRVPAP